MAGDPGNPTRKETPVQAFQTLRDQFLIAMPALEDDNFQRSVTYICEHTEDGAIGIVLNRPADVTLGDLLSHMELPCSTTVPASTPVYLGGPVQRERGFILCRAGPEETIDEGLRVSSEIVVSTSRELLRSIADGRGPSRYLIALGYAGWGGGQLEQELADNSWLTGPADPEIIFELACEQRWQAAARKLGIDIHLIANLAGHA